MDTSLHTARALDAFVYIYTHYESCDYGRRLCLLASSREPTEA